MKNGGKYVGTKGKMKDGQKNAHRDTGVADTGRKRAQFGDASKSSMGTG